MAMPAKTPAITPKAPLIPAVGNTTAPPVEDAFVLLPEAGLELFAAPDEEIRAEVGAVDDIVGADEIKALDDVAVVTPAEGEVEVKVGEGVDEAPNPVK